MVRLLNPKPLKKSSYDFELQTPPQDRKEIQQEFEKPYYLLNEQGLRRILSLYLKRKVLGPIISFSEIMNEFELPSKKIPVLLNMLQNLIKTKKIYADLLESNTGKMEDMKLIFTSKMKDPLNKKKMLGILFMTFIVIISVILYNHFFGFTI
jgi:hypothetical protein